jgi:hypothetical protein
MNRFVRQSERSWRSGAFFEYGESELLARLSSPLGQEIELRARGPGRKSLMSIISCELDALNASFEGLRDKVRKLVPCLCSKCRLSITPERYEERQLQKRKQDGRLTVECPESYEDVSVRQSLDRIKSTIKIFLTSSSDLREDRDNFELHLRRKCKDLCRQGIEVDLIRWETSLDAMSETRLQEDYNEKVRNSDIFVSLFKTKTGIYTYEEFEVAHTAFKNFGKPLIYTYFMQSHGPYDIRMQEDLNSLWDFQKKLKDLGHYPTSYTSIEDLQLQFQQQLDKLIDEGKI